MVRLTSNKIALDTSPDKLGQLCESNDILDDFPTLRSRMAADGYLLFRSGLERDAVLAARREILEKLDSAGELDKSRPLMEGISSGESKRAVLDQEVFLKSLRTGEKIRELCHAGKLRRFYERFLDGEVRPLDYIWVRTVPVGEYTGIHYDWVYMGRGTKSLYTTWIPVGDVPRNEGALLILENSHQQEGLKHSYGSLDVDRDRDNNPYGGAVGGWYSVDPVQVQKELGGRWLTTDFRTGDMLVFGMFTLHCSLDNNSPVNRIRITTDTRYQLAAEPVDERWVGPDPVAHSKR